jgi:hypothetical protein
LWYGHHRLRLWVGLTAHQPLRRSHERR